MQTINTSQLSSGLVLGEDIIKDNNIVYKKNKILDEKSIEVIQGEYDKCKILSLNELEPAILRGGSLSNKYIDFLVKDFNLLYSSAFDNTEDFVCQANRISKELSSNREALFSLLKLRQNHLYTYNHSTNVALLSLEVGCYLELYDRELQKLVLGAILHDLGKLYIDNSILDKPGILTEDEFNTIKRHPSIGYNLVNNYIGLDSSVLNIIHQHHEKLDGSGYPYGLRGNKIDYLSRITTVCDIYDAITNDRSYHKAKSFEDCAVMLNKDVKDGKLDNYVVQALISKTVVYTVDTYVKLSNGVCGFVVIEDTKNNRPVVYDYINRKFYDLKERNDLKIIYAV